MIKSLRHFTASLIPILLFSCEKSYGIEATFGTETSISISVGQTDTIYREQGILLDEMQQRHQIYDLQCYKGVWSIHFKYGRKARFSENVFPFIQEGESLHWTVSGQPTEITVKKDDNGTLQLPVLSVGEEGLFLLDSLQTECPTEPYLTFLQEEGNDTLNVLGFLVFEDNLYTYFSDGSVHRLTIMKEAFYLVPEYWMEHLTDQEKKAEAAIREADGDYASFVFFTDTHWGKNMQRSPSLIRHIIDFTPLDDVIFGGDVITTHSTNLVAPMELGRDFQASFAFLGTRFHCLYGNHDNNSDSQPTQTQYHLSEEQVYSWLQSQMTDVVYGGYYNFYYDNPKTKTRIICLDTGRYYYRQFWDKLPDTVSYVIEILSTLPDGWHAIMASHIWCNAKKQSDGTYKLFIDPNISPILKIFDKYNSRLSGVYTYNKQSISYDFSEAGGRIEFCIGGHIHTNYSAASEGGIPVLAVISDYAEKPQPKTDQEQSLTMVIADYKNKKLNLVVVGRGEDRCIDL